VNDLPPLTAVDVTDSKPNPNFDGAQKVARRPVRGKASDKVAAPVKPVSMPAKGVLKKALTEVYVMVGMGVRMWSTDVSDTVINNAENCAESLETLAESNETVRRVLLSFTKTSAWGVVAMAHAPIAMAVYAEMTARKQKRESLREDPTVMTDEEREQTL